ncbi:MAG TPA: hypothetical protein VFG51_03210 [Candidatus Saccharimonadia bacterium]|nr:hypothetical protein [Candidatus Saccharimonadia bacterium]
MALTHEQLNALYALGITSDSIRGRDSKKRFNTLSSSEVERLSPVFQSLRDPRKTHADVAAAHEALRTANNLVGFLTVYEIFRELKGFKPDPQPAEALAATRGHLATPSRPPTQFNFTRKPTTPTATEEAARRRQVERAPSVPTQEVSAIHKGFLDDLKFDTAAFKQLAARCTRGALLVHMDLTVLSTVSELARQNAAVQTKRSKGAERLTEADLHTEKSYRMACNVLGRYSLDAIARALN